MMDYDAYELITDDDFAKLPEEPEAKFIVLEQICRRNMTGMLSENSSIEFDRLVRMQYMMTIASAAEELGIKGLPVPSLDDENSYNECKNFMLLASGVTTRYKLRSSSNKTSSVRLAEGTRGKIEKEIQKLRKIVTAEDMTQSKRKALLKHLDDLSKELSQSRVSFAKVMIVLSAVSTVLASGTTVFAEGPQAITNITRLIGIDKQAEDAEVNRLGVAPLRKALPAPLPNSTTGRHEIIDDDIPF